MIHDVIERWHAHLRGELPGGIEQFLADDVVFYSPVVYTPQVGREITTLYLRAAAVALPGTPAPGGTDAPANAGGGSADASAGRFRYTKEIVAGDTAVLEFETTVDGKYVNGVDIIRVDEHDRIVEFRVMIRPLQAVNAVHAQMGRMLAKLQEAASH